MISQLRVFDLMLIKLTVHPKVIILYYFFMHGVVTPIYVRLTNLRVNFANVRGLNVSENFGMLTLFVFILHFFKLPPHLFELLF